MICVLAIHRPPYEQNRLGKLEELRAHLDLQVNLLTEQKTTKLIDLMEELRLASRPEPKSCQRITRVIMLGTLRP